jgi:hypothetical protein
MYAARLISSISIRLALAATSFWSESNSRLKSANVRAKGFPPQEYRVFQGVY